MTVADAQGRARDRARRAPARRHHARAASPRCARSWARSDPDATVTAGNASGQNDGAAVCIVTHPEKAAAARPAAARASGLLVGRRRGAADDGHRPDSGDRTRARSRRLSLDDIDLIELNEAFASQALAVLGEWDLPDGLERVNVHGSGISLGHPVGATGGRILTTLLRELRRRGRALRPGDDVHRRRSGDGGGVRERRRRSRLKLTVSVAAARMHRPRRLQGGSDRP